MVTLIAAYNSEGCIGRCDAKCYKASIPTCDCICGGMNHGAGIQKAMDNTTQLAESWMEAYMKEHPETEVFTEHTQCYQKDLWGDYVPNGLKPKRIRVKGVEPTKPKRKLKNGGGVPSNQLELFSE